MYLHSFSGDLTEGRTWGGKTRHGRGRVWLNRGRREDDRDKNIMSVGGEWAFLWDSHTGIYFEADPSEHEWTFHVALWKVAALWLHVEARWLPQPKTDHFEGRKISVGFHDGIMWWEVWKDPHSWSKTDGWRNSSWHWMDWYFGKPVYTTEILDTYDHVPIPMPEGIYEARIEMVENTWRRPHRFARFLDKTVRRADIEILDWPDGTKGHIPHPGRHGTADGLYDLSTPADNVPVAIAEVVERVLLKRWERGRKLTWEPADA